MKKSVQINPVTLQQLCALLNIAERFLLALTVCLIALGERFWPLLEAYLQG